MLSVAAAALLAGLVGSPHCIGMCGGFAMACGSRVRDAVLWQAGKLITYMSLGAVAGLAGQAIPGPTWVASVLSVALVAWFAAALAGLVPEPALRIPGLTRLAGRAASRRNVASRLIFGIAVGLLPCGLVYAALGIAVASGSALTGAVAMLAFGLGTAPALAAVALGLRKVVGRDIRLRRGLAVLVLLAGVWTVARRRGMAPGQGTRQASPAVESPAPDSGTAPAVVKPRHRPR